MSLAVQLGSITILHHDINRFISVLDAQHGQISVEQLDGLAKNAAYVYTQIFSALQDRSVPVYITDNATTRLEDAIIKSPLAAVILKLYPSFLSNDLAPYGMAYARRALAAIHETF